MVISNLTARTRLRRDMLNKISIRRHPFHNLRTSANYEIYFSWSVLILESSKRVRAALKELYILKHI